MALSEVSPVPGLLDSSSGVPRTMGGRRRTTMSQEFVGPLTVTGTQGGQGGSLELGATLGPTPETPYVDFHFGLGASQDFNVRLINTADNRLDVVTALGGTVLSMQTDKIGIGTMTPEAKLV